MTTYRQTVIVPNFGAADLLPIDELEDYAFRNGLDVTYPAVAPGWATTRLGSFQWAAWFGAEVEPKTRMPEAYR